MDDQTRPYREHGGHEGRSAVESQAGDLGRTLQDPNRSAERNLRARLDGMPCLVSVSDDAMMTGRMAVPPFAGERPPLPVRGRRATLDLLASTPLGERPSDQASLASIEIMIVEASRRSGRFAARVLGLTEDQANAFAAWVQT